MEHIKTEDMLIRKEGVIFELFKKKNKAEIENAIYENISYCEHQITQWNEEWNPDDIYFKIIIHFTTIKELFECVNYNFSHQFRNRDPVKYNKLVAQMNHNLEVKAKLYNYPLDNEITYTEGQNKE